LKALVTPLDTIDRRVFLCAAQISKEATEIAPEAVSFANEFMLFFGDARFAFIGEDSMRKKTIAWLFIIGFVLAALGGGINGAGMAASTKGAILTGVILTGLGVILGLISWIGALIATGKQHRWGWFVLVFLLSGIGELIYLIGGPALG
jgi:hypothetical protein